MGETRELDTKELQYKDGTIVTELKRQPPWTVLLTRESTIESKQIGWKSNKMNTLREEVLMLEGIA